MPEKIQLAPEEKLIQFFMKTGGGMVRTYAAKLVQELGLVEKEITPEMIKAIIDPDSPDFNTPRQAAEWIADSPLHKTLAGTEASGVRIPPDHTV